MNRSVAMTLAVAGAATISLALAQQGTQPGQPTRTPGSSPPTQPGQTPTTPGTTRPGNSQPGMSQPGMTQPVQQGQQNVDREFVAEAMRNNLFAIDAARHVAENAQSTQVRQFAETLAEWHQQQNEKLRPIAQQAGVDAPASMHEWQTAMIREMKNLPPNELERKFVFHQSGMHKTAELGYQYAISKGQNDQVKQLARQALPQIRQHMQQADSIARSFMAGGAGVTGEPGAPGGTGGSSGNSGDPTSPRNPR